MSETVDAPPPDHADEFAPRLGGTRTLACHHCGETCSEAEVVWEQRGDTALADLIGPLWYCPTRGCCGAGVGFDLHPIERPH